jgi:hypothetical protein
MRKYAGLLGLVYGGLKLEKVEPQPAYLRQLPSIVGLGYPQKAPGPSSRHDPDEVTAP